MEIRGRVFLSLALLAVAIPASALSVDYGEMLYDGELLANQDSGNNSGYMDPGTYNNGFCSDGADNIVACPRDASLPGAFTGVYANLPELAVYPEIGGQVNVSSFARKSNAYASSEFLFWFASADTIRVDYTITATSVADGQGCFTYWALQGSMLGLNGSERISGSCAAGQTIISGSRVFVAGTPVELYIHSDASGDYVGAAGCIFGVCSQPDLMTFVGTDVTASFTVTAVPVPAAVWLFASGLGLLGWLRRQHVTS
jgi:hypothetical protein